MGTLCVPAAVVGDRGFTCGGHGRRRAAPGDQAGNDGVAVPGLHLCGEILDVDGRIGGFNFQWAWASGHAAGVGAVSALPPGAR